MAGTASETPSAPPAAPAAPAAPITPPAPPAPPPGPKPSAILDPDNDPNMAMSKLVDRSRDRAAGKKVETPPPAAQAATPAAPNTPSAPPAAPSETPKEEKPSLTDLIGNALKFTKKPVQTPPAAPVAPPSPAPAAPPAPETPPPAAVEPEAPKKKGPKKPTPAPIDHMAVAREAATAATQAALQTLNKPGPVADPTDDLTDSDKRDYEIALHMARTDPRHKDAPKIILQHVKAADDYAARWEVANPGKVFDPNDEDHNEFYAQLQRPWTPEEFQDAVIDLRAEQKVAKMRKEQSSELDTVKASQGRIELAPVVESHFTNALLTLAEKVDPAIQKALTSSGWEGARQIDPVTSVAIAETMKQMEPFIEAVIHIDDPHRRFQFDPQNKAHAQWNQVVKAGEAHLAGQADEHGRLFARRADYVKMSPAQQANHWYLTQDMIIQGAVDYAAEQVKTVSEQQKTLLKQMGFERQATPASAAKATQAAVPAPAEIPAPAVEKPVSPSVGSGAKIDQAAAASQKPEGALIGQLSNILFRR